MAIWNWECYGLLLVGGLRLICMILALTLKCSQQWKFKLYSLNSSTIITKKRKNSLKHSSGSYLICLKTSISFQSIPIQRYLTPPVFTSFIHLILRFLTSDLWTETTMTYWGYLTQWKTQWMIFKNRNHCIELFNERE
jgi:hypothetical protein